MLLISGILTGQPSGPHLAVAVWLVGLALPVDLGFHIKRQLLCHRLSILPSFTTLFNEVTEQGHSLLV